MLYEHGAYILYHSECSSAARQTVITYNILYRSECLNHVLHTAYYITHV